MRSQNARWAIILAGGEGTRLSEFVRLKYGSHRPKQYCAFSGEKTMLARTLERTGKLVARDRIVTVIGPGHRRYLNGDAALCGSILEQPANLDTAPGIFLPLARVLASDPEATVLIFPSDHFIAPTEAFVDCVERAAAWAERSRGSLVVLGAIPDRAEPEFGWVELARPTGASGVAPVRRFAEKPQPAEAARLQREGALWNTMVMAVKAKTLWELGRRHLPEMMFYFDELKSAVGTPSESAAVGVVYGAMRPFNFSKGILERCAVSTLAIPLSGVIWNDWGRAERIEGTLACTTPSIKIKGDNYAHAGIDA